MSRKRKILRESGDIFSDIVLCDYIIWIRITKQFVHRFLLSSFVSVAILGPWVGKRSIVLV